MRRSTCKWSQLSYSAFLGLGGRKPARDVEFSVHHGRVVAVNGEVHTFKDNKGVRLLNVIKKMNKVRPMTAGLDGGENGLLGRCCFAGTNRRVLDQNIVFVVDLFEFIE